MVGRLVYLMGPSGAGKDTVLQGLSELLGRRSYLAPRLVTRPATSADPNAVHISVAEFQRLNQAGRFAMAWHANGLSYGVLRDIDSLLAAGCDVLVNGSRQYLPEAYKRYPELIPVLLKVDETLLAQRLHRRGRENEGQIRQRLARNASFQHLSCAQTRMQMVDIDNSGKPEDAVSALFAHLKRSAGELFAHQG